MHNKNARKRHLIKQFLKLKKEILSFEISLEYSIRHFKQKYNIIDDKIVDDIKNKFSVELLSEKVVDIYDKILTDSETEDLLKFYSSPLGKKLVDRNTLNEISIMFEQFVKMLDLEFLRHSSN